MSEFKSVQIESENDDSVPDLKIDSLKFGVAFALVLTALQRLVGLVRNILLCRMLPEDQLGQWSLTWSYLLLIAPLAVLGLPGSFSRYVEHFRRRGQLKLFLTRITLVSIIMTAVFSCLMISFSASIAGWLFRDPLQFRLVLFMALALLFVAAFNFTSSLMESLRQIRLVTFMRFVSGVSFALLAIGAVLFWNHGAEAVTIGFALSCLIGIVPAIWFLWKNGSIISVSNRPLDQRTMWSRIGPFAVWLWVINIMSNLFELADRNMLLHLAPVSSREAQALVGQYHSGRIIPLLLVGVAAMLAGILMPYMTARWERGERQRVSAQLRWTLKLVGIGFTLVGLVILLAAPVLFNYVLQGKYNGGWSVLPLTLVYCIWYGMLTVGQDYLWCREKGKWACLVLFIGLATNIGLNLFFIPRFSLAGAVWATTISNIACLIALYVVNMSFGWRPDRGVWLAAFIPLTLLLPTVSAIPVFLTLLWCAFQYRWIFDDDEIIEIQMTLRGMIDRTRRLNWARTS